MCSEASRETCGALRAPRRPAERVRRHDGVAGFGGDRFTRWMLEGAGCPGAGPTEKDISCRLAEFLLLLEDVTKASYVRNAVFSLETKVRGCGAVAVAASGGSLPRAQRPTWVLARFQCESTSASVRRLHLALRLKRPVVALTSAGVAVPAAPRRSSPRGRIARTSS